MTFNPHYISDIIYKHFEDYPGVIERIQLGVMTNKYLFELNNTKYIIRFYPESNKTDPALEFELLKLLARRKCKVPEGLFFEHFGISKYLIYKFIEGETLSNEIAGLDLKNVNKIASEIHNNISCISANKVDFFGSVTTKGGKFAKWNDFLQHSIEIGTKYLYSNGNFERETVYKIENFLRNQINEIQIFYPQLVWSDFSLENIIVNRGRVEGFIDFEGCLAGDPLLSLGYFYSKEGESLLFDEIRNCYLEEYNFDFKRIVFYVLIRLCRLAPYLNSPLPNGDIRTPLFNYFKGLESCIKFINNY